LADNTQVNNGSGDIVRDVDKGGIKTQVMGLDTNIGGSTERLTQSPDENLPARLKDLDMSLRALIALLANPSGRDAFGRSQVYVGGGALGAIATITSLSSLTTLSTITNAVNVSTPPGSFNSQFQPLSITAWADAVRTRIN
jgi:hypothetical protein